MPTISLVVPCYNEEQSLPVFLDACVDVSRQMQETYDVSFEVVLVDDGSSDNTLAVMKSAQAGYNELFAVRWVSFSRNFGKESALLAGLTHATGDYVATMDADMQDPPSLLPEMYETLLSGDWDNVATRRADREGEPVIRSFFSRAFYRIINGMSNTEFVDGERDFRLMKRSMVDAILSVREYNRFTKGIYGWVGFKTKWVSYDNVNRAAGETKWNFFSLARYSLDGIVGFSTVPLSISAAFGIILFLVAVALGIFVIVKKLLWGDPVAGWSSLMCAILFVGGLQLLCLGIIGQYLAKTYLEAKHRPHYIVKESNVG